MSVYERLTSFLRGVACPSTERRETFVPRKGPRNRALPLFLRLFLPGRPAGSDGLRALLGLVAGIRSLRRLRERQDQRRHQVRLLDVGGVAGAGNQLRLRSGHLPVALDRRLRVVDLILGAEDRQERGVGRREPLVERLLVDE